jgi:predicted Rossmann-fold nucleotide-binding protein
MRSGAADGTGQQRDEVPEAALPVIAVFGGAKDEATREVAEEAGCEIGQRNAILLTGGDDPAVKDLKGRVLFGAHVRARGGGATAPWIGVVRTVKALDPKFGADGLSLVLTPGGDHLRNYAEAEFCDAAIAFRGEEGTSSEVLFCLALGKPVILVGEPWRSKYPVVSTDAARDALRDEAIKRVPQCPVDPRLGPPIMRAYEKFGQVVGPPVQYLPLPPKTSANAVVEAVIRAAEARGHADEPAGSLGREVTAIRQFRASLLSRR